ncbi:tRNA (guanine(10)-N(2))-dimethyltransferase [Methanoplanus sp. FWC-SCC4]|uniref:tRNA (guanine(26)-N(2))-dimethyltransferase n=1 Tax=Methanochimaera problematica TaxID=2609417 RepID=A0AA97I4E3_9EURY|nr:tRNA (guanine(10)-N(2))-dimethyltransferase [Methanoplanus sp. FWC-SCC4]WOF16424.1 tRNA (guanine(10)-N(2))-dimethyltransferase [Methanoplanus sp. FWC-SCC4]
MELVEIKEGKSRFLVPAQDENLNFPPGSAPVFFNKRMEINRDLTILLLKCLDAENYLDAMGASGSRGIRVSKECNIHAIINDKSAEAISLIEYNRETYAPEAEVTQCDANVIMSERRFDVVDIDPFGTPAPFIDAAAGCAKKYLFITATDTAPLCGAHLKAGMRRYFARPLNNEYHSETGLRILLGFAVREIVKYDRGVEPLFCFAKEHFVRLHLKLTYGAGRADKAMENIGYIHQCPKCPYRTEQKGLLPKTLYCEECGAPLTAVGPLWTGPVSRTDIIEQMQEMLPDSELGTQNKIEKLLATCKDELETSSFYDYHVLSRHWKVSPVAIETVIERLKEKGFRASRVHYAGTGIKTDAPLSEIRESLS